MPSNICMKRSLFSIVLNQYKSSNYIMMVGENLEMLLWSEFERHEAPATSFVNWLVYQVLKHKVTECSESLVILRSTTGTMSSFDWPYDVSDVVTVSYDLHYSTVLQGALKAHCDSRVHNEWVPLYTSFFANTYFMSVVKMHTWIQN